MQTAVEWLIEQLTPSIALQQKYIDELKEQAKEMERNGKKEMYLKGIENYDPTFKRKNAETYGSKGSDLINSVDINMPSKPYAINGENITSQTEISDEEIEIEGWKYCYENKISSTNIVHWITACKWYREQLKNKI